MSTSSRIGTEVAGFRIESLLGRGGMSVVYMAEQIRLGRKVALKLMSSDLGWDTHFRERFVRESQLAATIDHPNIIPVYDAGESEAGLYIAMRYVPGPDLKSILKGAQRLSVGRTIFLLEQVASALDAAHARGLIHRDVKPANILVEEGTDHVFLTDFGVAKQTTAPGLTSVRSFLGTYDYAAPEQIERRHVDYRADIYALGGVLYECLTGVPPFDGVSEIEISNAHLTEPPPAPTRLRPELPNALDRVVAKAMAKDPEERYASCGELAEAARNAALRRPTAAYDRAEMAPATVLSESAPAPPATEAAPRAATTAIVPPPPESPPPAAAPAADPAGGDGDGRRKRMRQVALVAGLMLLAAGAAVAATVLLTGNDGSSTNAAGTTEASTGMAAGGMTTTGSAMGATTDTAMGTTTGMTMDSGKKPADQVVQSLVKKYKWRCNDDPADALPGSTMAWDCSTHVPHSLQIDVYSTAMALNDAYNAQLAKAGLKRNIGECSAGTWGGEQKWLHGLEEAGGRVFCRLSKGRSYLTWTGGNRFLMVAAMDGIDHPSLFYWWRRNVRHLLV